MQNQTSTNTAVAGATVEPRITIQLKDGSNVVGELTEPTEQFGELTLRNFATVGEAVRRGWARLGSGAERGLVSVGWGKKLFNEPPAN